MDCHLILLLYITTEVIEETIIKLARFQMEVSMIMTIAILIVWTTSPTTNKQI